LECHIRVVGRDRRGAAFGREPADDPERRALGPSSGECGSVLIEEEGGEACFARKPTDDAEGRGPAPPDPDEAEGALIKEEVGDAAIWP